MEYSRVTEINGQAARRHSIKAIVLAVVAMCVAPSTWAALNNPTLFERVNGIESGDTPAHSLRLAALKIDVEIVGAVAQFTVEAKFANPSNETLEGQFSLALPDGSAINGYALDIDQRMIEGVLVDQPKAVEFYESRVRGAVDPGVAMVSLANVFSTRIYPVLPEDGRTIRVRFAAPIHPIRGLVMPLATDDVVDQFSLRITAHGGVDAPSVTMPIVGALSWMHAGKVYRAAHEQVNTPLAGELRLMPSAAVHPLLVVQHASGRRFFQLNDVLPESKRIPTSPERLRVYWDRSLSRRDAKTGDEINLLVRFIEMTRPSAVDVVMFNSSAVEVVPRKTSSEVRDLLSHVVYRGATSFDVLSGARVRRADRCLLFSDGVATLDRRDRTKLDCRTTAITSGPGVDRGYLKRLVRPYGGEVVALDRIASEDLQARLQARHPYVLRVCDETGAELNHAVLSDDGGRMSMVGELKKSDRLAVEIANANGSVVVRSYSRDGQTFRHDGSGALWAGERIADLAARDKDQELLRVSRLYSVASPALAFLVLETPEEYAAAGVDPPASYQTEELEAYRERKAELEADRTEERASRLEELFARWEKQKEWWQTDFREDWPTADSPGKYALRNQRTRSRASDFGGGGSGLDTIIVTGAKIDSEPQLIASMSSDDESDSRTVIELEPWKPDRAYLKALDAAAPHEVDLVIAKQELTHGNVPAFYFDVAEWLRRHGRERDAMAMLTSVLELPARNQETMLVVADRLLRYGQMDRAVWLYELINKLSPHRPQPKRTLALALAKRSASRTGGQAEQDLRRAIELLNEVVMTPWDEGYDGIEMIALMDVNALLPKLRAHGVRSVALDSKLISPMDVDLRVVIEWNTGSTDLDLWIDEPTTERAMYSNDETDIGGRLSNDMTAGYGPEEYLLRRAMDGSYEIRVDVFSADPINPNGASTVTARLYRDFGRPTQREEMLDIELLPDKEGDYEGERLIGRFVVGKPRN